MLNLESKKNTPLERGWWLTDPASDRKAFGVVLHDKDGMWTVARTLIGSPAEKAGVKAGEQLVAIDEYELTTGSMFELYSLITADTSLSYQLRFRGVAGEAKRDIAVAPLRQLLEHDYDNGGAHLLACVGCRTCRPVTIGATDCSSGCPGNGCTIG